MTTYITAARAASWNDTPDLANAAGERLRVIRVVKRLHASPIPMP
jgi:hypothetical protein